MTIIEMPQVSFLPSFPVQLPAASKRLEAGFRLWPLFFGRHRLAILRPDRQTFEISC